MFAMKIEDIMDLWYQAEIRVRRDDALAFAERKRNARLCESTRSRSIRGSAADAVQSMSDALAQVAAILRPYTR